MARRKQIKDQLNLFEDTEGLERSVQDEQTKQQPKPDIIPRWEIGPSTVGGYRQWIRQYCRSNNKSLPKGLESMRKAQLYAIKTSIESRARKSQQ